MTEIVTATDDQQSHWPPDTHALVTGRDPKRAAVIRNLAVDVAQAGTHALLILDQWSSYTGLTAWPNVAEVATSLDRINDLIGWVRTEVDRRYQMIYRSSGRLDLVPIVIVVPDWESLARMTQVVWSPVTSRTVDAVEAVLSIGRSARVQLLLGGNQLPRHLDNDFGRAAFGLRVSCDDHHLDGAGMLESVERAGQVLVDAGDGWRPAKAVTAPRPARTPADRVLVAQRRLPAAAGVLQLPPAHGGGR